MLNESHIRTHFIIINCICLLFYCLMFFLDSIVFCTIRNLLLSYFLFYFIFIFRTFLMFYKIYVIIIWLYCSSVLQYTKLTVRVFKAKVWLSSDKQLHSLQKRSSTSVSPGWNRHQSSRVQDELVLDCTCAWRYIRANRSCF